MKKVLFISNVLSHIEAFHLPYLEWFKSRGYEVHIMTNAGGNTAEYCDKLFDIGIQRSPFNLKNISAIRKAKIIIDSENYQIIHSHTPMGGVVGRLASTSARKKGSKILYTAHGFHFYKGAPKRNWILYYTMEKYLAKKTDCIITINSEDYECAKEKFESKQTAIKKISGIGVDLKRFASISNDEKTQLKKQYGYEDKFLLIYAAEFIPRKNHSFFIEAATDLCKLCPNIKFLFCGKGKLMENVKKQAEERGVAEYFDFLGFRKDMPTLYKMSDILISASTEEGFGINIIEGMATGMPAVASIVRGHKEMVISGKNGFLFDSSSAKQFNDYIVKLYDDYALYNGMSLEAVKTAQSFSIENSLEQMSSIYEKYEK
ncbi:MAG: glycosyltransferase family 4 protein [Clostridia bacterium]|nr:glycosyltransferase family 4 protein [Clostridia bacterium]